MGHSHSVQASTPCSSPEKPFFLQVSPNGRRSFSFHVNDCARNDNSSSEGESCSNECVISVDSQELLEMENRQLARLIMNLEFENPILWKQYVVQYYLTTRYQFPKMKNDPKGEKKSLPLQKGTCNVRENSKQDHTLMNNSEEQLSSQDPLIQLYRHHSSVLSKSQVNLSNLTTIVEEEHCMIPTKKSSSKRLKKNSSNSKCTSSFTRVVTTSSSAPILPSLHSNSKFNQEHGTMLSSSIGDLLGDSQRTLPSSSCSTNLSSHSSENNTTAHESLESSAGLKNLELDDNKSQQRPTVKPSSDHQDARDLYDGMTRPSSKSLPPRPHIIRISQYEVDYKDVEHEFRREFLNYQLREYKFPQKKRHESPYHVAPPDQFLWDLKHSKCGGERK
ncbi:hypothetical protein FDP41_011111 [Naegleria fowleri]|uniref:Uncharacterized protein n=1 Tax=Naegleria fowleri TaxID=5763 RepID=A0A6A5BYC5_NAEFO|nr:uncharacterized protein FDP41_011111 [Naegleria fowleri]KAF0983133.1 hypothetical protein FDP41_011111 [Naegleria fowleri]